MRFEVIVTLRRTAEDIVEIGRDLIAVKERLGHGQFGDWLQAEFQMSDETARKFMLAAKRIGPKFQPSWDLAPSVLYALAAPSTPDEVITKATGKAAAGGQVAASNHKPALTAFSEVTLIEHSALNAMRLYRMEKAKKASAPVMQHIIPVMHLHRFAGSNPKGHVWIYQKKGDGPRSGIPNSIGAERHFYSYETDGGINDTSIEQTLSKIESSAEEPYRKLLRGEIPRGAERIAFAGFLATMYFRTRSARRMAAEIQSRFLQLKTYATANHAGAFDTFVRKFEAGEDKTLSIEERATLKSMMLDPSGYEMLMPKQRTLDIIENAKQLLPLIHDMTWTIAEPANGYLVTSDQPVCRAILTGAVRRQEHGFKDKDVEVSFPLNPKKLLLMTWKKELPNIFIAGRDFIDQRNALRVRHAENEIYSHIKHIQTGRLVALYKAHRLSVAGGTMPGQKLMPVRVPRRWQS